MSDELSELTRLGVATIYEAAGRSGLIDLDLRQIIPGSRAAGRVRTVRCAQGDNLMVHAAMAVARPGDILLIGMPEPEPAALIGELLATQARARGVAGIVLNGAVRDVEELRALGLPIWASFTRARGAARGAPGAIDEPLVIGGAAARAGDTAIMDADGAVVVPAERLGAVLAAARARSAREEQLRARLLGGELSIDIYGLRDLALPQER